MKKFIYLFICIFAIEVQAEDITTVKGKTYSNVQVIRTEPDGISVKHSGGIAKLFWNELSFEVQKKYGMDIELAKSRAIVQQKEMERASRQYPPANNSAPYKFTSTHNERQRVADLTDEMTSMSPDDPGYMDKAVEWGDAMEDMMRKAMEPLQ